MALLERRSAQRKLPIDSDPSCQISPDLSCVGQIWVTTTLTWIQRCRPW